MKRNVIITSSDGRYGDFLVHQWLRSLQLNVDLSDTDVVVIDYGLTDTHRAALHKHGVHIISVSKNGHITITRFVDAYKFLRKTDYAQVLFIDGGDIIFQGDISFLFRKNADAFRVATLGMEVLFFEAFIPRFAHPFRQKLWRVLKDKPVLNAGVIIAPKDKFLALCKQIDKLAAPNY